MEENTHPRRRLLIIIASVVVLLFLISGGVYLLSRSEVSQEPPTQQSTEKTASLFFEEDSISIPQDTVSDITLGINTGSHRVSLAKVVVLYDPNILEIAGVLPHADSLFGTDYEVVQNENTSGRINITLSSTSGKVGISPLLTLFVRPLAGTQGITTPLIIFHDDENTQTSRLLGEDSDATVLSLTKDLEINIQ